MIDATAERGADRERPAMVEVDRVLPGEADLAVDLWMASLVTVFATSLA